MRFSESLQGDKIKGNGSFVSALTGRLSVAFDRFDFLASSAAATPAPEAGASSTASALRASAVACAFDVNTRSQGEVALMRMSSAPGSSNMVEVGGPGCGRPCRRCWADGGPGGGASSRAGRLRGVYRRLAALRPRSLRPLARRMLTQSFGPLAGGGHPHLCTED